MVVHLEASGMLSKAIGPRLEVLCRAWADYRKAATYIRRYGFGGKHQAKASSTIRSSYPVIMRCLREFGCTPLSRSRLRRQGVLKA